MADIDECIKDIARRTRDADAAVRALNASEHAQEQTQHALSTARMRLREAIDARVHDEMRANSQDNAPPSSEQWVIG
jgi:hypothetical protein